MRGQNYEVTRSTLTFYDSETVNSTQSLLRAPWFKHTTQTFGYKKAKCVALGWCFRAQGVKNFLRVPATPTPSVIQARQD